MSETRPKSCKHCTKPTTLHLTKVIGGKVHKIGLCSNCPEAKALKGGVGWDLLDTPGVSLKVKDFGGGGVKCSNCGLTPKDFKEYGRLGCSHCYDVFEVKLTPLIKNLHKGTAHVGKVPRGKRRAVTPEELEALKRRLDEHVSREEYELAAVVRDQIKSLEES